MTRRDAGLTLIELVAAMAIFALIAVMGVQALSGSLRMRDRLTLHEQRQGDLATAVALLRNDMSAIVPLLFEASDGPPQSAIILSADGRAVAFSKASSDARTRETSALRRVVWRLSPDGDLTRQEWATLWPTSVRQRSPQVPVLTGVTGLTVRSFQQDLGWVRGVSGLDLSDRLFGAQGGIDDDGGQAAAVETYSSALPLALEIVIETRDNGNIRLVEALK